MDWQNIKSIILPAPIYIHPSCGKQLNKYSMYVCPHVHISCGYILEFSLKFHEDA